MAIKKTNSDNAMYDCMKSNADWHLNYVEASRSDYKFSTGSLALDYVLAGGLTSGIHRFIGATEGGKTSAALTCAIDWFKQVPEGLGVIFLAEGRLSKKLKERSGFKFIDDIEKIDKWVPGTFFVVKSNFFEMAIKTLEAAMALKGNPRIYYVLDSLDGLLLYEDSLKSLSNPKDNMRMAGAPLMTKNFLKRYAGVIATMGHVLLLISQHTTTIKDKYQKSEQTEISGSGGNAAVHFPNIILQFLPTGRAQRIFSGDEINPDPATSPIIGHYAKVLIAKGDAENRGYKVEYPIKHNRVGNAVWVEKELYKACLSFGIIRKPKPKEGEKEKSGGSWLEFSEETLDKAQKYGININEPIVGEKSIANKFQGENKFCDLLEASKPLTDFLVDYAKEFTAPRSLLDNSTEEDEEELIAL